jgi:hypothetical protein
MSAKRQTTMAKLARERAVKEKREKKREKKAAAAAAKAAGLAPPWEQEAGQPDEAEPAAPEEQLG